MNVDPTTGERVASFRRQRGLSQKQLAVEMRRSESWVSQVERGVQPVERLQVLQDLASVLGVTVGDLRPDALREFADERHAYLAEGNAMQARKRVAADVLIRDRGGRVMLVNPTYKPDWDLPGGMAKANEPPTAAAARELREELALVIPIGRLLVLEWVGPHKPWDDELVFVSDGGALTDDEIGAMRLCDPELSAFEFVNLATAGERLRPSGQRRLSRAVVAVTGTTTDFAELHRDW